MSQVHRIAGWLPAALLACACTAAQATDYVIDTVHTQVYACTSHLGFTTPCARFKVKRGFFHFDDDRWADAQLDVVVDAASIDLGDAKWNHTVRSWQFLDAERFPDVHFRSTRVEQTGAHAGIVHGLLTLRGITRPLELQVMFHRAGPDPYTFRYTAGFTANATLMRSDFGMKKYLPDIGDEVTIRIKVEGLRGKPAQDHTAPVQPEP